ncbi:MAG: alpha/beta fold hydrolase [Candidatus Competibacteraceae bacterium]
MSQRSDVEFTSQGVVCRAWLYMPVRPDARPAPCIVMAPGLGGTRDAGLEPYARRFADAGYVVLLFDYRHFGASDGEPRQLVSTSRQLDDWAAAIAFARRQPGIDGGCIALWGTSFSGGHVLVAAARDGRIAAVSAQCPLMDGLAAVLNLIAYAGFGMVLRLTANGLRDLVHSLLGRPPVYVPIVAPPGHLAAMSTPDAEPGYRAIVPPDWRNEAAARLALTIGLYRPVRYARRVPCPILIQVCAADSVAPTQAAIAAADKIGPRAELTIYPDTGHFDLYLGAGFEHACADQLAFFERVLRTPAAIATD